jgi:hypothetical protein
MRRFAAMLPLSAALLLALSDPGSAQDDGDVESAEKLLGGNENPPVVSPSTSPGEGGHSRWVTPSGGTIGGCQLKRLEAGVGAAPGLFPHAFVGREAAKPIERRGQLARGTVAIWGRRFGPARAGSAAKVLQPCPSTAPRRRAGKALAGQLTSA